MARQGWVGHRPHSRSLVRVQRLQFQALPSSEMKCVDHLSISTLCYVTQIMLHNLSELQLPQKLPRMIARME